MKRLSLDILAQPTDTTCGPTCLHALYRFYNDELPLQQLIDEVTPLVGGGTLAVFLGLHALRRGYRARIYTYNLTAFDPTWFKRDDVDLVRLLEEQSRVKSDPKLNVASEAYRTFLSEGGEILHRELRTSMVRDILSSGTPILTGLSATYLYDSMRERDDSVEDDLRGGPVGHFVVLTGYEPPDIIHVADPLHDNPRFKDPYYKVGVERLLGAILLGIITYDANLLVIEPKEPNHP